MDFILEQFEMPQKGEKISELHGQELQAQTPFGDVTVVPLHHPAVALYNRDRRQRMEKDFEILKGLV